VGKGSAKRHERAATFLASYYTPAELRAGLKLAEELARKGVGGRRRIWVDGWCKHNGTSQATSGFSILVEGEPVQRMRLKTGPHTSNVAEYQAVIYALELARARQGESVIYTDSQLVIGQVLKGWKCKQEHLIPLRNEVQHLLKTSRAELRKVDRHEIVARLGH